MNIVQCQVQLLALHKEPGIISQKDLPLTIQKD